METKNVKVGEKEKFSPLPGENMGGVVNWPVGNTQTVAEDWAEKSRDFHQVLVNN